MNMLCSMRERAGEQVSEWMIDKNGMEKEDWDDVDITHIKK